MHYFKKTKQLFFICLFAFFTTSTLASSSSLNVKNAELIGLDEDIVLNANVDIKFNDAIEQAISKGFELNFLVEFQLLYPRKYWFDDEIVTITQQITLSYHALSRQYILIRSDQQKTFATLDEAKEELSQIRDIKVLKKSEIEKGGVHKAVLLMRLDYKKLPKALQIDAIGSDELKMSSQRFEWAPSLVKFEPSK